MQCTKSTSSMLMTLNTSAQHCQGPFWDIVEELQHVLTGQTLCCAAAFGVVRNPYSLDRSTAGSSGGPAAGAAASYAMISFGTDTGNSIRGPSGHQGLVGLRSSIGQTSRYTTHANTWTDPLLIKRPAQPAHICTRNVLLKRVLLVLKGNLSALQNHCKTHDPEV